jgi:3'-5' exonuclease
MQLATLNLEEILFIDIETVPLFQSFKKLDPTGKSLWKKKAEQRYPDLASEQAYEQKAGIHAEFSQVIIAGCGFFHKVDNQLIFRVKTFYAQDEKELLSEFIQLIDHTKRKKFRVLCAHNGKEFDFPFLCRRMLVNGLTIPPVLDLAGKKPWEVMHLDTLELWKFGDRKHYTSLELMAYALGIPTSKDAFNGSMVHEAYKKSGITSELLDYCSNDVILLAQVFLRLRNEALLGDDQIIRTP